MVMAAFIFILTIASGAFLLFQVQPIISKYILPWFGGTSAVWITAMLFFQVLLLLGYAYIFFLGRFSLKKQIVIHLFFVSSITILVIWLFTFWHAPILPDISWKLSDEFPPILQVLGVLFISVGLPYFLLSTTSIVLQKWYSDTHEGKSPYLFYAFSNAASLIGVVSYPLLIEPFLSLQHQGIWWSVGFLLYSGLLFIACFSTWFLVKRKKQLKQKDATQKAVTYASLNKKIVFLWFTLAAIATLMLLAITNVLTQAIAPVPFLWLLPLTIYLFSFIVCFSGEKWYWRDLNAYLFILTMPLALIFAQLGAPSVVSGALIYGIVLLSACMLCHGELYAYKPHPKHLDLFYVVIALGGAASGILVGIIAPLFFKGIWEVYIGFYLTFLIAIVSLVHYKGSFVYRYMHFFFSSQKEIYILSIIGFPIVFFIVSFITLSVKGLDAMTVWRSFYGVLTVKKKTIDAVSFTILEHGHITHGKQASAGPLRYQPNTYYGKGSGVYFAFMEHSKKAQGLHVGIVGLGTGTLAAFGKKGETYRFYEINPQVVEIANKDFTYLKDSQATVQVITDDGRLALEKEVEKQDPKKFDLLVLDAFNGDAIPVHLLTKEAFAIYLKRLDPASGVIAVHISNNYLDLKPPLVTLARYYGLQYAFISAPATADAARTDWALFTYNKNFLSRPTISAATEKNKTYKESALWTDDYSNLVQILK